MVHKRYVERPRRVALGQHKSIFGSETEVIKTDEDIERAEIATDVPNLTLIMHFE